MSLEGKIILLAGGTGSFGQKFVEVALKEYNPDVIRIFSRGELLQQEMCQRFHNDERLRFFIGDVRDRERLSRAMYGVHIVVDAAALKIVPTCEYNPIEAIRTNIDGTVNVIDAAIDNSVDKVVGVSSDKGVLPANLYGATKMVMEKLFVQANVYSGWRETRFSCTRYGNVVGSRGSIIPIFLEQKKTGEITITDKRMTRFWLTLEQGVRFVIKCIDEMRGGEIFIPKIPSMKIMDLAEAIAPDAKKKIIGIRPGEKLNETLLTQEEARHTKEFDDYFIVEPELSFWRKLSSGEKLPDGFSYTSDNNSLWLSKDELSKMAEEF